jgi:hypothetical protein
MKTKWLGARCASCEGALSRGVTHVPEPNGVKRVLEGHPTSQFTGRVLTREATNTRHLTHKHAFLLNTRRHVYHSSIEENV